MPFDTAWRSLINVLDANLSRTTFVTPLSQRSFHVTGVEKERIRIKFQDRETTTTLHREQFEGLYENITTTRDGFAIDRLPPIAEPYAAILSHHPSIGLDEQQGVLAETGGSSKSAFAEKPNVEDSPEEQERNTEPSIDEMLENMGNPSGQVACPIDGCRYTHRSPSSVASHVSASNTDKHIWENTSYAGWRDFVRKHGESPS